MGFEDFNFAKWVLHACTALKIPEYTKWCMVMHCKSHRRAKSAIQKRRCTFLVAMSPTNYDWNSENAEHAIYEKLLFSIVLFQTVVESALLNSSFRSFDNHKALKLGTAFCTSKIVTFYSWHQRSPLILR